LVFLKKILILEEEAVVEKSSTLAVMFADIAQSTQIYDKIGNAAAFSLISTCVQVIIDVCNANSGTLIKTIGDEIMYTFPTAEAAVIAAKLLQPALDNIPKSQIGGFYPPDIYVGLDFGPVIEKDSDVFGDSVNVAARMVKLAKRRQIFVTSQIIEALPDEYREHCRIVDSVILKGKSEAVPVYEIVWEKALMTMSVTLSGETEPLIRQRLILQFAGKNFEINDKCSVVTIGRLDQNHITLDDSRISRFHARIEFRKDKFFIVDQSTNGTHIKNDSNESILLRRDELQLGSCGIIDLCRSAVDSSSATAIVFYSEFYANPPLEKEQ